MARALFSMKFGKKSFTASTMKEAYLKACKWYATNILSKDELRDIQVEFEKDKQFPTVTIHLYAMVNEREIFNQHCLCCKEMHHNFMINENTNCNICAAAGYQNRLEQKTKIKQSYYRQLFNKLLEE